MQSFSNSARADVQALRASKIREVANAGMGRDDVVAFWFGEPDQVTPDFIRQAAIDSLQAGETFYSQNLGIPPLRAAIANYVSRLHRPTAPEHVAATNSGMSALMLVVQALVGHGDRVVAVTPLWPNLVEAPRILGAHVETVALRFTPQGWTLDLDRLLSALTPNTKALFVNSPNNPTGWTIDRASQRALLDHCRRHGIWVIGDDVYERLVYDDANAGAAPSFLDLTEAGERVVSTNSFSKAWLMTGFRLGWIVAPPKLIEETSKLIEYNTSCAPTFVQRAGVVALEHGEEVVTRTVARFRHARDLLLRELNATPGVEAAVPSGAMYAFFRVSGITDSLALCRRLVAEFGLGLAPGVAFGAEGEGFVRWCFAATDERLHEGVKRLRRALETHTAHR